MENENIVYGRLTESVHISGYSLERAVGELNWLLEEDRWKKVGGGYAKIKDFLKTLNFSDFKIAIEQRKDLAKKLADLEASERVIAEMLGVSNKTINRDLNDTVTNVTKEDINDIDFEDVTNDTVTNVTKEDIPAWIEESGQKIPEQKAKSEEKKKDKEEQIEDQKQKILSGEMNLPEGIFDMIVVDPPWPYARKYDPDTSRSANPYPEMSIEEITSIGLTPDKDCILWLWTTHRFIWDAKNIMDLWGFEYKGILVWNKEKMGMGDWLRMQCEFCLLGIKGKPLWDVKDLRDIITEPRTEHSSKPDSFYQMIEDKFISKNKADYFGRKERKGWKINNGKRSLK